MGELEDPLAHDGSPESDVCCQRVKSEARLSINLYYEAVLNHSNGVAWFSQALSEALDKGFDYYAVMAYHRLTMRELHMEERKALDLMAEVTEKAVRSWEIHQE